MIAIASSRMAALQTRLEGCVSRVAQLSDLLHKALDAKARITAAPSISTDGMLADLDQLIIVMDSKADAAWDELRQAILEASPSQTTHEASDATAPHATALERCRGTSARVLSQLVPQHERPRRITARAATDLVRWLRGAP